MMAGEQSLAQVAAEVEHAVRRLDGLSILPSAATRLLSTVFGMRASPRELTEVIESEPALAVLLFSLAARDVKDTGRPTLSLARHVEQLPLRAIRDGFFSLNIYRPFGDDGQKLLRRRQLVANAAAVAYCAREIAEFSSLGVDGDEAYTAGLLYSIGNLALDDAMPRSFAALVQQAQDERLCISDVQERNLGVDYTILGKHLAAKWHLPPQVQSAAWLHQGQGDALAQIVPHQPLVQAVHLAYLLARKFQIGQSGSFDPIELPADEQLPGISIAQLDDIGATAKARFESQTVESDWQTEILDYSKAVQAAAAQLAVEGSRAAEESRRSATKASHFDFATEFLTGISADSEPIEVAERFVCQWKKFYQTGKACLYLAGEQVQLIEAAVVGDDGNRIMTLKAPAGPAIPPQIQSDFAVIEAAGLCDWLFEQLDTEFEVEHTKIAPLICRRRAIGAIVFEFHYPVSTGALKEMFEQTCFVAAAVLDAAMARSRQQRLAEQFARLALKRKAENRRRRTEDAGQTTEDRSPQLHVGGYRAGDYIPALAEMAAGAAHELNNPLSVISGRAQLLAQDETDADKVQTLNQIRAGCKELSRIVGDLMSFAQPPQPRPALVATRQIIDEALELAALKTHSDSIDAQVEIDEAISDVLVDSGQVVSSLASIITNAVESYGNQAGPVQITARRAGSSVQMEIVDHGCGMDAETLAKATYPFFSSKAAGRKQGMGLAYAARLIELNGGFVKLTSEPGKGTTATVTLPCS
jgi:signal transduction histidine kinase/HD-like signal output (HDOD) protein